MTIEQQDLTQEVQLDSTPVAELAPVTIEGAEETLVEIPVIESTDFHKYNSALKQMAADTVTLYSAIASQNVDKDIPLIEIAESLMAQLMAQTEQEVHSTESVEAAGLITVYLPLNTPFLRLQRALTVASMMSGEPIPSELTMIDGVSSLAATTLLQSQQVVKDLRNKKKPRRNSRTRRKAH